MEYARVRITSTKQAKGISLIKVNADLVLVQNETPAHRVVFAGE